MLGTWWISLNRMRFDSIYVSYHEKCILQDCNSNFKGERIRFNLMPKLPRNSHRLKFKFQNNYGRSRIILVSSQSPTSNLRSKNLFHSQHFTLWTFSATLNSNLLKDDCLEEDSTHNPIVDLHIQNFEIPFIFIPIQIQIIKKPRGSRYW